MESMFIASRLLPDSSANTSDSPPITNPPEANTNLPQHPAERPVATTQPSIPSIPAPSPQHPHPDPETLAPTNHTISNCLPAHPIPTYESFDKCIEQFRSAIVAVNSPRQFTPLFAWPISRSLIENSFDQIMAIYPIFDQLKFIELLDTQQAISAREPGDDPARWASINAVLALSVRAKIPPVANAESESMVDIADAFYRNALGVFADLVMRAPSLLSVQALLAMAVYVRDRGESTAFIMLVTDAARRLDLFGLASMLRGLESGEAEQFRRVVEVVRALEAHACSTYGVRSVLAGRLPVGS
ncbi:hypothetical protein B0T19DRAFT_269814 [Cercophora scortea]|uniref:Uncharacterized protein n=1 Tax=Cercophora scortea TaxID=314031 RepID=A0AAE0I6N9_9PEZI|nr:hypothetical protein B0T19DRAFT_269814 [Cercophora scortea]